LHRHQCFEVISRNTTTPANNAAISFLELEYFDARNGQNNLPRKPPLIAVSSPSSIHLLSA